MKSASKGNSKTLSFFVFFNVSLFFYLIFEADNFDIENTNANTMKHRLKILPFFRNSQII